MTDRDRLRLAKVLAILAEAFGESVSELRAEAYFLALADLPIEAIEGVSCEALNSEFFPRPRALRELIEPGEWDRRRSVARSLEYLRKHDAQKQKLLS